MNMINEEDLVEELKELRQEIGIKRKFGVDSSEEKQKAEKIEKLLIDNNAKRVNNQFIASNTWLGKHIVEVDKWDLIIYQNVVCKLLEMGTTGFNPGEDTYNYRAKVKGIFLEEEFTFDFGYYETIKVLRL